MMLSIRDVHNGGRGSYVVSANGVSPTSILDALVGSEETGGISPPDRGSKGRY